MQDRSYLPARFREPLGYRKNGQPFYLIAGGSGEDGGEGGTEGTPPAGDAGTTPGPQANGAGSQQPAGEGNADVTPGTSPPDDDKTARTIAAIRGEFKDERAKRQAAEKRLADIEAAREADRAEQAERNRKLAIALGVASEDEPPDPAKLAEELERTKAANQAAADALKAEIRQRDIRLAVLTQAPGLGANGLLLMDSLSFLGKLSGLDPAADDFTGQIGEAIKAAAEANPQYKAGKPAEPAKPAPSPPRSGGEFNGAPGGNRQWTREDVDRASPAEVVKAQEDGLLIDLGFHPKKSRR
jgi:hypothetical protein